MINYQMSIVGFISAGRTQHDATGTAIASCRHDVYSYDHVDRFGRWLTGKSVVSRRLVGYLGILHVRKHRELLHLERIKAFESGILWQEPGSTNAHAKFMHNAFYISFWMVSIACGGSFTAAGRLSVVQGAPISVIIIAWLAAAGTSIAAVVCATVLMIRSKSPTEPVNPQMFFRPPLATLQPLSNQSSS